MLTEIQTALRQGDAHFHAGEFDQAANQYSIAITLITDSRGTFSFFLNDSVYKKRGNAYLRLAEQLDKTTENYDYLIWEYLRQSLKDFTEDLRYSPKDAATYNNRGHAHFLLEPHDKDNGHLRKAMEDYKKALELDPTYAEVYFNQGNVHAFKVQREENERQNGTHVQQQQYAPQYAHLFSGMEEQLAIELILQDPNQLDLALKNYNEAIRLNPQHAKAYLCRGNIYVKKGLLDNAFVDFCKAIQLTPAHANDICQTLKPLLVKALQKPSKDILNLLLELKNGAMFANLANEPIDKDKLLEEINKLDDKQLQQKIFQAMQNSETFFGKLFPKHNVLLAPVSADHKDAAAFSASALHKSLGITPSATIAGMDDAQKAAPPKPASDSKHDIAANASHMAESDGAQPAAAIAKKKM